MAQKQSDYLWQCKKSVIFIFSFIPFVQWIPFFAMNGRIPKKRWILMGFANIAAIFAAVILLLLGDTYGYNHDPDYPENEPQEEDYFESSDYWEDDDYTDTPEYKQYEQDLYKWYESEEYKNYEIEKDNAWRRGETFSYIGRAVNILNWILFMILGFFVERYKYLRALKLENDRNNVYERIADVAAPEKPQNVDDSAADATKDDDNSAVENTKINVNNATEAELLTLPGIKTIDVKKIIEYRTVHGGFKSEDDFFEAFGAKPHIIVKLQKVIDFDNAATETAVNDKAHNMKTTDTVRRFDL